MEQPEEITKEQLYKAMEEATAKMVREALEAEDRAVANFLRRIVEPGPAYFEGFWKKVQAANQ